MGNMDKGEKHPHGGGANTQDHDRSSSIIVDVTQMSTWMTDMNLHRNIAVIAQLAGDIRPVLHVVICW